MTDGLRVAYLTSVYPRASDSFIRGEIEALRRQGVSVTTVAIRPPDASQLVSDDLRREASRTRYLLGGNRFRLLADTVGQALTHPIACARAAALLFKTHPAGLAQRVKQLAYLIEAASLVSHLRAERVGHVHNHIGENSASVAMAAAAMSDVTFSLTIHGPGIFFHPRQWALGEKITRSSFTACITRFCQSQCMIFTPPSAWEKLRVVRCGVGERFLGERSGPPPGSPRFVCVGRLCPEKGHWILVQAVERLVRQGLAIEVHLVGDGELRPQIERFVRQHDLQAHVILHGWATAEQIKQELVAARALVLPSFAEGLPVVFMEAMAMRRPVIATRIAGIPELIEDGVHGWLIPPSDVDSLCTALQEASQLPLEQIESLGDAGRAAVRRNHHVDREATKLKRLFAAIADGAPLPDTEALERNGSSPAGDTPPRTSDSDPNSFHDDFECRLGVGSADPTLSNPS